jgi:hypothetical protein
MYRAFHKLKETFGERMRLLYTDTDSLILHIKHDDLYKEVRENAELRDMFDLSNVPEGHASGLHDPERTHDSEVGYFKEELKWDPIIEFVGLRPKMYSIKV